MTISYDKPKLNIRGYVLTVDYPAGPRRASMANELAEVPFPWSFIDGVRPGDRGTTSLYCALRNLAFHTRGLADIEVAVYAAHRKIWIAIAEQTEAFGLIFEDDTRIRDRDAFLKALADVSAIPGQFDMVKLFDFRPKAVAIRTTIGSTQLVSYKLLPTGAACYLVSKDAARKLLKRKPVYRAVDQDFTHAWEAGIRIWSVFPNPVDVAFEDHGGSMVETERNSVPKNRLRAIYGLALQAKKQLHTRFYQRVLLRDMAVPRGKS